MTKTVEKIIQTLEQEPIRTLDWTTIRDEVRPFIDKGITSGQLNRYLATLELKEQGRTFWKTYHNLHTKRKELIGRFLRILEDYILLKSE